MTPRRFEDKALGPTLEFMRLLWAVDHGLQSASKSMATQLGVTGPQRLVVRVLGRAPGEMSSGDLARVLHLHPSTLTGVLQRLVGRGCIERHLDPTDRRRSLFRLSAAGRRLDAVRRGTVEATVGRVLARIPQAQMEASGLVLSTVARALLETHEPPPRARRRPARPARRGSGRRPPR